MNRRAFCLSTALALPTLALAQPPKEEPKGPATDELRQLRDEDQADRQFTKPPTDEEWKPIAERDRKRRERTHQLLTENKVVTGEDFDLAYLIYQHGETPEDYQMSHELAIIANFLGKFGSSTALSEDRFLQSIKRRQRFGSQFAKDGSAGEMPDTKGPTAVTDTLRLDAFVPPLDMVRQYGLQANQKAFDRLAARVEPRLIDKDWQKKQAALPEAKSLRKRAATKPTSDDITYALDLYHADKLNTAEDYYNAARILSSERSVDYLLLTHELAVVAIMRRYAPAQRFVAWSWDRFQVAIGRPQRFGLATERIVNGKPVPEVAPDVTDAMRKKLGLLPLKQLIPSTINPARPIKE